MSKNRIRSSVIAAVLFAGALMMPNDAVADDSRPHMQGEVDRSIGYVQHFSEEPISGGYILTAQIKIRRTGTYVILGGYMKGECWLKGWLSGARYYDKAVVSGDEGDVVTVRLTIGKPPMNRNVTVGVFNSEKDICTKG